MGGESASRGGFKMVAWSKPRLNNDGSCAGKKEQLSGQRTFYTMKQKKEKRRDRSEDARTHVRTQVYDTTHTAAGGVNE